jgi:hypothetical protein
MSVEGKIEYAHLSQEHKKKAVNLLNGLTALKTPTENFGHKQVTNANSQISASC